MIDARTEGGNYMKITLEDWAENLIDRALLKHAASCPLTELDHRIRALEVRQKMLQWLLTPVYLGLVAWIIDLIKK